MTRKVKTNIYMSPKQMQSLKRISARTGAPVAELIRRGVDLLIKKHKK